MGSIPLLLDDCFAGLSAELTSALLFRLERTADRTQIIYLTDERSLADLVAVNFVSSAIVTTGTGFFQPRSAAANP